MRRQHYTYLHEKFCYPLVIATWDAIWQAVVETGLQPTCAGSLVRVFALSG